MKVKIKKINDPNTDVAINSPANRIEQIKSQLVNCNPQTELCEVNVYDMWEDMPGNN